MSEGGGPRRSARIASKRQTTSEDENKPKRMKSDPLSRALTAAEMYAKRLRGVFSFRQAIPVLDEYLSSIRIDDDDPGFLFNWLPINVGAFVTAANGLDPAQAPLWLRTPLTTESFIDDVIDRLRPVAGGHVEWVLLAPNTPEQFAAIHVRLAMLQAHDFMQDVAQAAFPIVNIGAQYLATTYLLTDTRAQQARPNRLEAITPSGQPLCQLFF